MEKLSDRLGRNGDALVYWCPACNNAHVIQIAGQVKWDFDGNVEAPTFNPSVRHQWVAPVGMEEHNRTCHYFVKAGRIEYCGDCTHELAGQTVELPPIPTSWFD